MNHTNKQSKPWQQRNAKKRSISPGGRVHNKKKKLISDNVDLTTKVSSELKIALNSFKLSHINIEDIQPYGSRISGLNVDDSDIDIHITCSSKRPIREMIQSITNVLRHQNTFIKIIPLYFTKVPLIKCIHRSTGVDCDLSFNNIYAVQNTYLLKQYITLNHSVKPVLIGLKLWAKKHDLINTYGFSSYSFYWLGLFFFQVKGMLPTVYDLQKNIPELKIGQWNCAFSKDTHQFIENEKMATSTLLDQIYNYYSNFEYENFVICPYLGCLLPKSSFENVEALPEELTKYKQFHKENTNQQKLQFLGKSKFNMYVQDPFQHNYNITARVTPKIFLKFIDVCKKSKLIADDDACTKSQNTKDDVQNDDDTCKKLKLGVQEDVMMLMYKDEYPMYFT
ncbi:terminal uridylyltransferase Tailor-like [Adelges cooleyi]|uniref:terminal uridylyltransferase Tailor-like n=1 Tax=Adelges cooleyi TaxID=133065 RepID=UPI002180503D|nr:terminal uridylyltransferase Tailor-like [Adelges cooleyi]